MLRQAQAQRSSEGCRDAAAPAAPPSATPVSHASGCWCTDGVTSTQLSEYVGNADAKTALVAWLHGALATTTAPHHRHHLPSSGAVGGGAAKPAARAAAAAPQPRVALLLGPTGSGKSTLVHAAARARGVNVCDATAGDDRPSVELRAALKRRSMAAAAAPYVVLVDAWESIDGHDRGDMVKALGALDADAPPVVITSASTRWAQEVGTLVKRAGVVLELRPLPPHDVEALLRSVAAKRGGRVAGSVVHGIVAATGSNVAAGVSVLQYTCASPEYAVDVPMRLWLGGDGLLLEDPAPAGVKGVYVARVPPPLQDGWIAVGQRVTAFNGEDALTWTKAALYARAKQLVADTLAQVHSPDERSTLLQSLCVRLRLTTRCVLAAKDVKAAAPAPAAAAAAAASAAPAPSPSEMQPLPFSVDERCALRDAVAGAVEHGRTTEAGIVVAAGEDAAALAWVGEAQLGALPSIHAAAALADTLSAAHALLSAQRTTATNEHKQILVGAVLRRAARVAVAAKAVSRNYTFAARVKGGFPAMLTRTAPSALARAATRVRAACTDFGDAALVALSTPRERRALSADDSDAEHDEDTVAGDDAPPLATAPSGSGGGAAVASRKRARGEAEPPRRFLVADTKRVQDVPPSTPLGALRPQGVDALERFQLKRALLCAAVSAQRAPGEAPPANASAATRQWNARAHGSGCVRPDTDSDTLQLLREGLPWQAELDRSVGAARGRPGESEV